MALTRLEDDLNIISKLDNQPNDVGGLSPEDLKAKFDEAVNIIKDYLNAVLIPGIEDAIGAGTIEQIAGDKLIDESISAAKLASDSVVTRTIGDSAVSTDKLASSSVTTDKIASKAITAEKISDNAVGTGQLAAGAVNTASIATYAVTSYKIENGAVLTGKIADNAVTAEKLAAGATHEFLEVEFASDAWVGDEAPFTQEVSDARVTANDQPIIDIVYSSDAVDTIEAEDEAYALIYKVVTADGTLTAYAKEKPEIGVKIKMRRDKK